MQLVHEVATVVSKTPRKEKFTETISRIKKYKELEKICTLQGIDREKIAGIIWETHEREAEKLKVFEKRKREWKTEGRVEPRKMKHRKGARTFSKHLVVEKEKQLWKEVKESQEGEKELLYVRIPRSSSWKVKDR